MGDATCALNASASTLTRLCCITSPAASAASVAVAVLVPSLGYAVSRSSMPSFAYLNAQTVHLLLPPSSYAGSTVTLITDRLDSVPEVWLGNAACSSVQLKDTANGRSNVCSIINSDLTPKSDPSPDPNLDPNSTLARSPAPPA